MRKIHNVLRLRFQRGLGLRQIARSLGISHSTVHAYLQRAEAAGVSWPLPAEMTETELERRLFPQSAPDHQLRPRPDWHSVHRELRRKGVTLMLLWQDYKAAHPDGYPPHLDGVVQPIL